MGLDNCKQKPRSPNINLTQAKKVLCGSLLKEGKGKAENGKIKPDTGKKQNFVSENQLDKNLFNSYRHQASFPHCFSRCRKLC